MKPEGSERHIVHALMNGLRCMLPTRRVKISEGTSRMDLVVVDKRYFYFSHTCNIVNGDKSC